MAKTGPDELSRLIIPKEILEKILKKYAKAELAGDFTKILFREFKIIFCALQAPQKGLTGDIYHDNPYNFILVNGYPPIPICLIGFDIDETGVLKVGQIQGVKGQQENLKWFRWERMMLNFFCDWAKLHGHKEVRSIKGRQHNYCNSEERRKAFYLKYDVTARREGFKYDPILGCYRKNLDTI